MTRMKDRLDRGLACMSDDAKIVLSTVLAGFMALSMGLTAGSLILAILGFLVDVPQGFWWWPLAIPGGPVSLAATIALWKLSFYVTRDVPTAGDWWW